MVKRPILLEREPDCETEGDKCTGEREHCYSSC